MIRIGRCAVMTDRIKQLWRLIRSKEHHIYRKDVVFPAAELMKEEGLSPIQRKSRRLKEVLEAETPILLPEEQLVYLRTVKNLPPVFTKEEWAEIESSHFIHELGHVSNLSPDYATTISQGLLWQKERCQKALENTDESRTEFYQSVIETIDAVLSLAGRYRQEALRQGKEEIARVLERVPAYGARTFREALQSFRILHYTLWCEGEYHNTVGRFDQYMYPYLKADLEDGRLTEDTAFELIEEFFLSFNKDSDLYPGIQQGDNGQSMMLGGVDEDGNEAFNLLSELCLKASCELKLIDPKINLRVSDKTPLSVYELGTNLTKQGLGFPQYSNDDVVIPGLLKKGYSLEDARNYTVAACWEFIIPRYGMEIPNIGAVNFPKIVNDTAEESLSQCKDYAEFYEKVAARLKEDCAQKAAQIHDLYVIPAPFLSILMDTCIERGRDISLGAKYNNFGFHGVGISTAVDSLANIKRYVFEQKTVSPQRMIQGVKQNFASDEELEQLLRYESPKFGDNDDVTNQIAQTLLSDFGKAVEPLRNERGGCYRAGTGSAMFYLWYADHVDSAPSGHQKGEAFAANFSPELFVKNKGPLSVIQSFTAPDFTNAINGGPLTMEFHSTVFRDEESIRKVAMLVKSFVSLGGHQLQLNSVNRDMLLDAQKHPENYQNLIVRIWGWSAYFTELDKEYQDHVIARQEFAV